MVLLVSEFSGVKNWLEILQNSFVNIEVFNKTIDIKVKITMFDR